MLSAILPLLEHIGSTCGLCGKQGREEIQIKYSSIILNPEIYQTLRYQVLVLCVPGF